MTPGGAATAPAIVFEIAELALGLAKIQTTGNVQQYAVLADTLAQIVVKAALAYKEYTGQPLDPSLIKPE